MKNRLILIAVFLLPLICLSCEEKAEPERSDTIAFKASGLSKTTLTRAAEVTSLSSFYANCVTGSAGSESSVWNNKTFTLTDGYYVSNAHWPQTDPSYTFYASNQSMTFAADGPTVAASNATDVVCARLADPVYKYRNTLYFKHIFARIGNVTFTNSPSYTVSGISVTLTPVVSGTYNLLEGANENDGTGWSDTVEGSIVSIANGTPGTKTNDIWLVPGRYILRASWTASIPGTYTKTFTDIAKPVELVSDAINVITATLAGEAADISFNVSLEAWDNKPLELGTYPLTSGGSMSAPSNLPTFGGLNIAPAPLYYNGTTFQIKDDDWNHDSYNSAYGRTSGSYYFNFVDLGSFFDSRGSSFTESSGSIDNNGNKVTYGDFSDWRLPTITELQTIFGTTRAGSTVNGTAGMHYACITLTGVTVAGTTNASGVLLFPDGMTITGAALSNMDNNTYNTGITNSQINSYIEQGCAFIGYSGRYASWGWWGAGDNVNPLSATESSSDTSEMLDCYLSGGSGVRTDGHDSKTSNYMYVRLVRTAN